MRKLVVLIIAAIFLMATPALAGQKEDIAVRIIVIQTEIQQMQEEFKQKSEELQKLQEQFKKILVEEKKAAKPKE